MEKLSKKKIKMRELTKNEKFLLTLLGIVLIGFGSYRYIITPQIEKMNILSAQKNEYETKIDEMNEILRKESNINKEWDQLHREKEEIVSQYFPRLDQAQVIYLLNDLLDDEGVSIEDMNFNRPGFEEIEDFQVKNMDITMPYNGEYLNVVEIINTLKSSPRKIFLDSLSMDRDTAGTLNGNMSLKVYSLDGIADSSSDVVYIDLVKDEGKNTPFAPFNDYTTNVDSSSGGSGGNIGGSNIPETKPYIEEILLDFESRNTYFLPSQKLVKGNVSQSTIAKSKKYSLRFEYNIIAIEEENRGFIDVSKNNILMKYPPNTIGLWIYAFDYSPATVGILFRGQMGEEVFLPLTEGIGWTGWKYVEVSPPADLRLYPLTIDKLYVEIPKDRDNYGVLLMDKLEAVYLRNMDEDGNDVSGGEYIFHVVERGENVENISVKYYGSNKYTFEILKLNEMQASDTLSVGKVLVLKKR